MKPKKIIDLSFVMYNCMPTYPTAPNFLYEQVSNCARDGATVNIIRQMATHVGTHTDAPLHFIVEGKSVDQLSIEAFAGEGIVIDLSYKKAKEKITVEDLSAYDEDIRTGDVLMLHTNWDKKFGFNHEYLFEWPYLDEETAKYLVGKKVKALGIDTFGPGGWEGEVRGHGPTANKGNDAYVHRTLLGAGIILVENLRNLDLVLNGARTQRAYFIYAPIALRNADGGPCRALALLFE